jgi:hypothetical protein
MQALLAAAVAFAVSFIIFGLIAWVIHKLRHSRAPFWWGVLVAALLVAVYAYFNYLGR